MERISALMDGEIDQKDVAQVVRHAKERSELREAWSTYHLIGEAMRGERLTDTRVVQAVTAGLATEPTVLAPKTSFRDSIRRVALPSMAAAAAVAAVTWVSLETYQNSRSPLPLPEIVVPMTAMTDSAPLGSFVQPVSLAPSPPQIQLPSRRIDAYLEAHQEFSPARTIQGLATYARTVSATGGIEAGR